MSALIKNMEDTVVFLTRKVFISLSLFIASYNKKSASHFCRETAKENKHFKGTKTCKLIQTRTDKAIKGSVVNRALSSLHRGSLDIPHTVPIKQKLKPQTTQTAHTLYLRLSRPIVSRHAMLRFHVMFFD